MTTKDLRNDFYIYGNKGAVWTNKAHIAQSGVFSGTTLCGTPMLATNWARIEKVEEIGCLECQAKYKEIVK